MKIHLIDGTYELFRQHFGAPERKSPAGTEVGATVGLLRSLAALIRDQQATHLGCAFDTVIRSFRNDLFDGYKTGEGVAPELLAQFPLAERAAQALGIEVWPGIELEADDLMASAAARWADHPEVEQVVLCSPDKDLAQCVRSDRVVCLDRRRGSILDEAGVHRKFGVGPASIPDLLALMGDAADGIPGIPRWGQKSSAAVLSRYGRIEDIPLDFREWEVSVRGAQILAANLGEGLQDALLYKRLATLRSDADLPQDLDDLRYRGVRREALEKLCKELGESRFLE